jgi:SAM-dependent methyltransferase
MTGSLAYRKNEAAIIRGDVPDKYTRLLPYITGQRILEIGSAEGVLALLLARDGKDVTALEKSEERHTAANRLYAEWLAREEKFNPPTFINGTIDGRLDLLKGMDTVVAVRMIYYLRYGLARVFDAFAHYRVQNVVLCGNRNRADRFRSGVKDEKDGPHNFYASREGMRDVLTRHGYKIVSEVKEGDEVVVDRLG